MTYLFHLFFYRPIFNLVIFLYNYLPGHDLGVVIVVLTLLIKIVLYPLAQKAIESQKSLQDLQPKIDDLKIRYANNKEELGRATLELYKNHKVNPFGSCLPLLIQFPFLIAVFRVFRDGFSATALEQTYSFVSRPILVNSLSLGFLDLSKPSYVLAILAGLAQFWQAKTMITKRPEVKGAGARDEDMAAIMNKQMLYMMPAFTVIIGITLPSGLSLYWLVSTLFQAIQQWLLFRKKTKSNIIEGEIVK